MEFTSFTLESGFFACEYDSLEVYDGSSTFDSPLGTYCGPRRPPPITTSGNTATLLFASDESETEQGFSINYRVLGGPSLTTPYYGGGGYHPATPSTPTSKWVSMMTSCLHYWPFVRRIHWWPVDSPHKGLVTRNLYVFFDVRQRKRLKTKGGVASNLWPGSWCDVITMIS